MTQKEITIGLATGLEARPVAMFVQLAGEYESQITVEYKERKVNAKSIMGMMSLGIAQGERIRVYVDGADEEQALGSIEAYLSGKGQEA